MVDSEVLTKIVCMVDRLNKSYSELGELIKEIDNHVEIVVAAHDRELKEHRYRLKCLEEDVGNIKKVVGL